jgi:hypothetical protein
MAARNEEGFRDRLHRKGPDAQVEHAKRQVIDGDVDPGRGEHVNAGRQLLSIIGSAKLEHQLT